MSRNTLAELSYQNTNIHVCSVKYININVKCVHGSYCTLNNGGKMAEAEEAQLTTLMPSALQN